MHQHADTFVKQRSRNCYGQSVTVHADMKNRLIWILFQTPECCISLPFLWIWQNIVVIQLQIEKHYSMRWFHVKSRGGRFALIWDSCLSTLCEIVLVLFFRPKLSPEVELDEFKRNRWFNFRHNLLTSVWTKCENKTLVTTPHTFMQ